MLIEVNLAEWSKALRSGRSPQGRGFEPHRCHFRPMCPLFVDRESKWQDGFEYDFVQRYDLHRLFGLVV